MYRTWLLKVFTIFTAFVIVISLVYKIIVVDRVYDQINYKISDSIDTLAIGASHIELGIDDTLYENVKNFSKSGMPYFISYIKSKKLIESNPQVKKLIISFSPIHVSPYGDSMLFSDTGLSRETSFSYFPLFDDYQILKNKRYSMDFILCYLKYNLGMPFNYMEDLKPFLKSLNGTVDFVSLPMSGNFDPSSNTILKEESIRKKANFYFGDEIKYSNFSIEAINLIAEFTKQHDVSLYILNMPNYIFFRELTPKIYVEKLDEIIKTLLSKYDHINYIDYYEYPLNKEDFYDGDHINTKGLEKLSPIIKQDLDL